MLFSTSADASYITMETNFGIRESDNAILLKISAQNKGDEPAYAVQFEASLGKAGVTGQTISRLNVNQNTDEDFEIRDAFTLPGHYPVIIKTHYQDANSYPFSSLTLGFYDYKTPVISDISVKSEEIDIPANGSGELNFTLRNNSDKQQELSLELHVPDELATNEGTKTITIGSKEKKTLAFAVENFSALENSSYAVFLIGQYDDKGKHYSISSPAIVRIKPMSAGLSPFLWLVITIITAFILIVVVLLLRRNV
ncbi:hypothetical protein QUF72_16020 [Desulfobacterales bacterium HSG2]|nr:hypothetical protein [Desulfobacterales bacterium HSG2]